MKKISVILGVVCVLLWAGTVFAYPVTLSETGVSPNQTVNVAVPGYTGGALAGVYQLTIDGQPFSGYCVDPALSPTGPTLYDITGVPEGSVYERAAWLFNKYGTPADAALAANIQVAIWRLVWPAGSSVTSTSWIASSQTYFDAASAVDLASFDSSAFSLAVNPIPGVTSQENTQDYIIRTPVPEPATMLLLGLGLIGVAGIRRKFKG